MSRSNSPRRRRFHPDKAAHHADGLVGRCALSGKRSYPTKAQAKAAVKRVNRALRGRDRPADRGFETGVYQCECGAWHTTSAP